MLEAVHTRAMFKTLFGREKMRQKSDKEKSLHGTIRQDRGGNGLKLDPAIPQCPISLSDEARVIWRDLSEKLVDL